MSNLIKINSFLILVVIFLSGCNTTPVQPEPKPWWYPFVLNNHSNIEVMELRRATTSSGEIELALTIKNTSSRSGQEFIYKVEWFNVQGMGMNTILSRWNKESLIPKEISTFTMISPGNKATDFRILINEI